jgi:hypothetical protein
MGLVYPKFLSNGTHDSSLGTPRLAEGGHPHGKTSNSKIKSMLRHDSLMLKTNKNKLFWEDDAEIFSND